ncbi:hypothetical protein HK101_008313 [Irineochytrium annulatum]|nr:hypothetical protein HK101_008313 [Irineochytrium annulatum]
MPSFLPVSNASDFPIENIPFGVISTDADPTHRIATIIGDHVIDLRVLTSRGLFSGPLLSALPAASHPLTQPTLNAFMALGRPHWREARATIQKLFAEGSELKGRADVLAACVIDKKKVRNHMPARVGDYTDFYASKEHAMNVGAMFRGRENALMPNWVHLPVGYHGRASSVVISGTPIRRPCGLVQNPVTKEVSFSPSKKLDYEVEVAFFVGVGNQLGDRIDIEKCDEHIFGMVLMNDWSARDIQAFEYVPLGPFLGKNFGTTISPWIVTMDALEHFRVPQPQQDPVPAQYLLDKNSVKDAYDLNLFAKIKPQGSSEYSVTCATNFKYMYWSFKQQLAHHTINGCNVQPGDLCGSGTISGEEKTALGSLLEASMNGKEKLQLSGGVERSFIEDGDEVSMHGFCSKVVDGKELRIGFGSADGVVLPPAFGSSAPRN